MTDDPQAEIDGATIYLVFGDDFLSQQHYVLKMQDTGFGHFPSTKDQSVMPMPRQPYEHILILSSCIRRLVSRVLRGLVLTRTRGVC